MPAAVAQMPLPVPSPIVSPPTVQEILPAGWLVVTGGVMAGRDFTIKTGENAVGRAYGTAIALTEDASVAERNHASVYYDAGGNSFSVKPGPDSGFLSVNGRSIASPAELRGGDMVRFGATHLVLIPLAGREFRWQ